MTSVAIVDFGLCNLDSISRAVSECGGTPVVSNRPEDLTDSSHVILPGVGTFADAVENLHSAGLVGAMTEKVIEKGAPFLGICLGMQLLAENGAENGDTTGLGWIKGAVKRLIPVDEGERVPHVGWNEVTPGRSSRLFDGIADGTDFYFVHGYHFECGDPANVLANTPYCGGFVSAVNHENIFGVQFHPEKSQKNGFQLLRNFLSI